MDNPEPYWTRPRIAFWAILAVLVSLAQGPLFLSVFRPQPGSYCDFIQEWLSAKNYMAGQPIYRPQREAILDYTGQAIDASGMPWNGHPPVAVLVALPFGLISDYGESHFAWNVATFALFIVSVLLVLREFGVPLCTWSLLPAITLTLVASPVIIQLFQGQLNFLLALLLTLGWVADRHDKRLAAGIFFGLAAGLKLFPALIFVYLLFAQRWRTLAAAMAVMAGANAVAWVLFGTNTFITYIQDVMPSLEVFRASWRNVSIVGFWLRVLESISSILAHAMILVSVVAIISVISWLAWTARSINDRDRAFAAVNVGMILASPVAWTHYLVLMVLPLGLLWMRLDTGLPRILFLLAASVLWLPQKQVAVVALGKDKASEITNLHILEVSTSANIFGLSAYTYALVVVFGLLAFASMGKAQVAPLNPTGASPIIPTEPTT